MGSEKEESDGYFSFTMAHEYDRDLIHLLPPIDVIDQLIDYYFEYCNWVYRHVNQASFTHAWSRFKEGRYPDRIVLATVCMIMSVSVQYLPEKHTLLENLPGTSEELGHRYYDVMRSALQRHSLEPRSYTLELVELHLIRCHFQTLCKTDSEEIWNVIGELKTIAIAMGLHRDPGMWKMTSEVAERRRWCWWHFILLERLACPITYLITR